MLLWIGVPVRHTVDFSHLTRNKSHSFPIWWGVHLFRVFRALPRRISLLPRVQTWVPHISLFLRWRVPSTGQERHQSRRPLSFQDSSEYPRILRWLQSFLLLRCLSLRMNPGGEGAAPGTYGCIHVCFAFTASVHQHFCFYRAGLELSDYV